MPTHPAVRSSAILLTTLIIAAPSHAQKSPKPLLGIVSIAPAEANNVRFIEGARAAATARGWDVTVIDAHGSADQANSAVQNLVQRKATAIIDMVFPVSSLGAGLRAATAAKIPVGTWGGGLGGGTVVTNGSGGPLADPIVKRMVADMNGKGAVLALTYRTGQVCREREDVLDKVLKAYPNIKVTKNEVRIPGYLQDGAQFAGSWLASHPAGSGALAVWGCWDDPAVGAISTLRQQNRKDVKVYGQNGNADALNNITSGWMTATAYQNSVAEGTDMVKQLEAALKAGSAWTPKAVEVPAIVVDAKTLPGFLKANPGALK
ncbi:sugar ABC transporter substrate-binding protein [Deinococcus sp.]|uniref:sugar ABC transporter substrate-binding protein n=1 Tax=Deinococcus sp. TaxID=47478 RepID=UPI002869D1DA|nr:sugar ABC transporter substrate-binding protein [Deinococcus sp.]